MAAAESLANLAADLHNQFPEQTTDKIIFVDVSRQALHYWSDGELVKSYDVSTSRYGIGSASGSNKTPLGAHFVKRKYGADAPLLTIFKGRKNTGKQAKLESRARATGDDFVTTRILWLQGLEPGQNLGDGVDSYRRYIYIHGTHEEGLIGQPASHGCIRMRNNDVIELFEQIPLATAVYIAKNLTIE